MATSTKSRTGKCRSRLTEREQVISRLEVGIRAPDFTLPTQDGAPMRLYGHLGGTPSVIILWRLHCESAVADFCNRLRQSSGGAPAECHIVVGEGARTEQPLEGLVLSDASGTVARAYGMTDADGAIAYLVDPNLRVVTSVDLPDHEAAAVEVRAAADSLPPATPREIRGQAPVLLIDRILDSTLCERLASTWETGGHAATGVEKSSAGRRDDALAQGMKRRRDHVVDDAHLLETLTSTLGRRVIPELQKSFSYRASRFEGFKIARYAAEEEGFFHAHRDNLSPATAHRRFALTVNLNDDYDGGQLVFPEYGRDLYRPNPGSALIFSCSHLHEVTPVTRGNRFALLSFLFGERDLRKRET